LCFNSEEYFEFPAGCLPVGIFEALIAPEKYFKFDDVETEVKGEPLPEKEEEEGESEDNQEN